MLRGELQHVAVQVPRGHEGSLHRDPLQDQPHVRNLQLAVRHRERVDDRPGRHDGQDQIPVGRHRGRDEEAVDGRGDLELLGVLGGDEFVRAELQGLALLPIGAGQDHHAAAHLRGKLDGQVAEPADAHDADGVGGLDALEGGEGGGAAALEGSGVDVTETLGDAIEERLPPDGVGRKAPLVLIRRAVHLTVGAEVFGSLKTLAAVAATVDLVAPADVIPPFQGLAFRADGLDNADALMAQDHVLSFLPSRSVCCTIHQAHVGAAQSLT